MTGWVVRGIGMALVHVIARVLLGAAVSQWPLHGSQLRWLAMALVLIAVIAWAGLDGIRDRKSNPDPDYGADLTILWLKAAAVGGLLAGLIAWLVGFLVDFSVGQNTLFFELTSGAAFTVLLIFIPATIAVFVGRLLVSREAKKKLDASDEAHRSERHDALVGAGAGAGTGAAATRAADSRQDERSWSESEAQTEVFPAVDLGKHDSSGSGDGGSGAHRTSDK